MPYEQFISRGPKQSNVGLFRGWNFKLASDIPKKKVSIKIEVYREIDLGIDTVKPIIDTMKMELAELNNVSITLI